MTSANKLWLIAALAVCVLGASCKTDKERRRQRDEALEAQTLHAVRVLEDLKLERENERNSLKQLAHIILAVAVPPPRNQWQYDRLLRSDKLPKVLKLDVWKRPRYCSPIPRGGLRICSLGRDGKRGADDQCVELIGSRIELHP